MVEIYEKIHKHILQVLNRNTFKHNILRTHDKIVYHKKNKNKKFPRYLLTHLKITLLVDKWLTYVAKIFFLMKFFFNFMRKNEWKKIISWELFYCTWNHSLLYANVPTLLRTIPLAPSKILLKTMVNTWHCLKNASTNVTLVSIEINWHP